MISLIYNKCGEYRFLCVHFVVVFLLAECGVSFYCFAVLKRFVVCVSVCVILRDLGSEFSTCGFSFESTLSTTQTCENSTAFFGYCFQTLQTISLHLFGFCRV